MIRFSKPQLLPYRQLLVNGQKGFSLVELMVVIVIMAVMSTIAVVSVSSSKVRQAQAVREQVLNDLSMYGQLANRLHTRIGLRYSPPTNSQPASYQAVEDANRFDDFDNQLAGQVSSTLETTVPKWVAVADVNPRVLPTDMGLTITPLTLSNNVSSSLSSSSINDPQIIWSPQRSLTPSKIELWQQDGSTKTVISREVYVSDTGALTDEQNGTEKIITARLGLKKDENE